MKYLPIFALITVLIVNAVYNVGFTWVDKSIFAAVAWGLYIVLSDEEYHGKL